MNPDVTLQISASTVAWYGAVVATTGLLISLWNSVRDRARVFMQVQTDMEWVGDTRYMPGGKKGGSVLILSVINRGRRPVKIERAGVRVLGATHKFKLLTDSFNQGESRVITEESPSTRFTVEQDLIPMDFIWYFVAFDGAGREYRKYHHWIPWKALWKIYFQGQRAPGRLTNG